MVYGILMPVFAFILVFVIVYGVLSKTKIFGEANFIYSIIALVFALMLVLSPLAKTFTLTTVPIIAVFLVCTFFLLFIMGFVKGDLGEIMKDSKIAQAVLILLLLIFFFTGIYVFAPVLSPYMPWGDETGLSTGSIQIKNFLLHPSILSLIVLFIVAAIVAFILNKK